MNKKSKKEQSSPENLSSTVVYLREADKLLHKLNPEQVPANFKEILLTLLVVLEQKDSYTLDHSLRVAKLSKMIASELGLSEKESLAIELSALLHDIGKIGIPEKILMKPGPLTRSEFEIMKSHSARSVKIVEPISMLKHLLPSILCHHERIDGYGYPDGIKGEKIPFISRIVLVADTFDAMTSTRPYRLALDKEIAFAELERFSGTQFDPEIVKAFLKAYLTRTQESEELSILKKTA